MGAQPIVVWQGIGERLSGLRPQPMLFVLIFSRFQLAFISRKYGIDQGLLVIGGSIVVASVFTSASWWGSLRRLSRAT
jgi:hypothetical protein